MDSTEFTTYYANLLILQYLGKPKAYATIEALLNPVIICQLENTVQTISFDGVSASGSFELVYGVSTSAAIAWNASNATIKSAIQAIVGDLVVIAVTGSIASQTLTVLFNNTSEISVLTAGANSLMTSAPAAVAIDITGIADQGPLALSVQNAFNLIGSSPAVGKQLDILGKYAGVSRNGYDFSGPVTLDDSDFLALIKMAIVQNSAGSSLYDIEVLLNQFFPGSFLVFDYANMHMDYWFLTTIGSRTLIEFFVKQRKLPKPMGVQLGVTIYAPALHHVFGFRTYTAPAPSFSSPFNSYVDYDTDTHWLSYADGVV